VTWLEIHGSDQAAIVVFPLMRSSQVTLLAEMMAATMVEEIGFETDASWNTVSASTESLAPTKRFPNPAVYWK
jgi:hypothetical protein